MRCQKLVVGDVVLVKEKDSSGNYKINDKWELYPYTVLEHMMDKNGQPIPVYRLKENVKTGVPCEKILHRICYILFDWYKIPILWNIGFMLLVKANILMDIYFDER